MLNIARRSTIKLLSIAESIIRQKSVSETTGEDTSGEVCSLELQFSFSFFFVACFQFVVRGACLSADDYFLPQVGDTA